MKERKKYSADDLFEAWRAVTSLISKCVKVQRKLRKGTAQYTLIKNRLKALRIASALLKKESGKN